MTEKLWALVVAVDVFESYLVDHLRQFHEASLATRVVQARVHPHHVEVAGVHAFSSHNLLSNFELKFL